MLSTAMVAMGLLLAMAASSESWFWGEERGDEVVVGGLQEIVDESPAGIGFDKNLPVPERRAQRYCEPRAYVWGKYMTEVRDCSGVPLGEWAPWLETGDTDASEDGPPGDLLIVTREDVESLLVDSGGLVVQPEQPWVLVNADTIVMTDAEEHILSTQVLDLNVDVRVAPVLYTWNFGDGSVPVTGSDPGAPWPDHTVSHVYRDPGTVTISLRTEWDAAFRVEGTTTWIPVTGRAVTVQSSGPIDVVTATPRLTTG